jgi:hypothetical protein
MEMLTIGAERCHGVNPVVIEAPRSPGRQESEKGGSAVQLEFGRLGQAFKIQVNSSLGSAKLKRLHKQALPAKAWLSSFKRSIGESGGKALVIQHPNLHFPLPGLIHYDIHVPPPKRAAEVGVRAAFNTHGAAIALLGNAHVFAQNRFIFTMKPEEWHEMISALPLNHLRKAH